MTAWLMDCCRLWEMLSTSFVTRLSSSPRWIESKYRSGSRLIFASISSRSREHRPLHHPVQHVRLHPHERRRQHVQHQRPRQHAAQRREVDPRARASAPWR